MAVEALEEVLLVSILVRPSRAGRPLSGLSQSSRCGSFNPRPTLAGRTSLAGIAANGSLSEFQSSSDPRGPDVVMLCNVRKLSRFGFNPRPTLAGRTSPVAICR
mgnify:CR=1 FL=1